MRDQTILFLVIFHVKVVMCDNVGLFGRIDDAGGA